MNSRTRAKQWSAVYRTTRLPFQRQSINEKLQEGTLRKWFSRTIFTVEVTFSGYIAYETKSNAGNETEYQTVQVGNLNDTSRGLLRKGQDLTYTYEGVYGRYLVFRDISTSKKLMIA
ncbi:hypothetical protein V5799_027997 [Amblyomma americanum]|uniref:Uncharacterized protein n=1 Tax=Amblyomma americanum TaxID=6943 RepID=A0AAQ4DE46_AMBAM